MRKLWNPYQIAVLKCAGYKHYVELMSFPTPEQTIMLRRVVGHAGTLEEHPIDELELIPPPTPKLRFVHYAQVRGFGQFPVDMLRYEWAAPVNFKLIEDPRIGGRILPEADPSFGALMPIIQNGRRYSGLIVAHVSARRAPSWTPERWQSFLWQLDELKTEELGREAS